jgi:hypothetical protein
MESSNERTDGLCDSWLNWYALYISLDCIDSKIYSYNL